MAAPLNPLQHLDADGAYRAEERIQPLAGHPWFVEVEQGVVAGGLSGRAQAVGYLALEGDGLAEPGREEGEIVVRAGAAPGLE